ncbi:MAG: hypothetical protein IPL03_11030 [Sterolibacteriaceae bacterium]|nr:hypothetical protein [Candidatus Methylophosphatis haderslevensis]
MGKMIKGFHDPLAVMLTGVRCHTAFTLNQRHFREMTARTSSVVHLAWRARRGHTAGKGSG